MTLFAAQKWKKYQGDSVNGACIVRGSMIRNIKESQHPLPQNLTMTILGRSSTTFEESITLTLQR